MRSFQKTCSELSQRVYSEMKITCHLKFCYLVNSHVHYVVWIGTYERCGTSYDSFQDLRSSGMRSDQFALSGRSERFLGTVRTKWFG